MNEPWKLDAACRDSDVALFFGDLVDASDAKLTYSKNSLTVIAAKKICSECPVADECLDYALDMNIEEGIYGGRTPAQRRYIKRVLLREAKLEREGLEALAV